MTWIMIKRLKSFSRGDIEGVTTGTRKSIKEIFGSTRNQIENIDQYTETSKGSSNWREVMKS